MTPQTKKAIIVPGWKKLPTAASYTNIAAAFRRAGYEVLYHEVSWTGSTLSKWTHTLLGALQAEATPPTICAFGLGGMIAVAAGAETPMERLILCSPSGYFKEYMDAVAPGDKRWMGDDRKAEFYATSAHDLLSRLKAKTGTIVVDESSYVSRPGHKQWMMDLINTTNWEIVKVMHEPQTIDGPAYQRTVMDLVAKLAE